MTTATATATSYIVALQNNHGGWQKIGFVNKAKRFLADEAVSNCYPRCTRCHEDILKACKFLEQENANWVELEAPRQMRIKVIRIR
jgi:hypothetical protein